MYYNAYDHRIFDPSTSWINRAGVHLEYAPEDTLRSVILNQESASNTQGNASHIKPSTKELRESPDGSLPSSSIEPQYNTSALTKDPSEVEEGDGGLVKSRPQHPRFTQPAPFLKRRQGVSAWCSKIRKQGLPVRDPAEELRRRRCGNSPATQNRPSSLDASRSKSHTIDAPRAKSALDSTPNPLLCEQKKSNTLWCGLKHRRSSNDSLQDEEVANDFHGYSRIKQPVDPIISVTKSQAPPVTNLSLGDDVHTDGGDLEEFELLEEMAENSSFSSLTTSFVTKLGRTCLRDRLKRAESKLEVLGINNTANCALPQESEDFATNCVHNSCVAQETVSTDRPTERSILSVLDKHRSRRNSEHQNSFAGDRITDSILADTSQNKSRKVARFQFVNGKSHSKEEKSMDSCTVEPPAPDAQLPPEISVSKPTGEEVNVRESVEFDDGNSWTGSASELGEATDQVKVVSALDLSSSATLNPAVEKTSESRLGHSNSLDRDQSTQRKRRILSRSPSSPGGSTKTKEPWNELMNSKRFTSRPSSAASYLGSKTGHLSRNATSSYEDELISLADDFVDQLRREPPPPGRSAPTQAVLRQWISRLEAEVRRFKVENANLVKMRSERDESMRRLELETKRFQEYKAREIRLFTEMKENETRKLKKERRVLEEYQRALKSMPNKKDREEIDRLKEELHEARSDLSRREVRWHAAIARLRTRIEELERERDDFKGRVHRLEEERISLQSQLAELKVSGSMNRLQLRRNVSSVNSTRQTLSSVTQSIALKPSKSISEDTKDLRSSANVKRVRQQKQSLSTSRLAARQPDTVTHGSQSYRPVSPVVPVPTNLELPAVHVDRNDLRSTSTFNQVAPSNVGTRESVVSGGYFTGEDECISNGSVHVGMQKSKGDATSEQNTATTAILAGCSDPSLHKIQALSTVSRPSNPNPVIVIPQETESMKSEITNLPLPHTAASGSVIRTIKHADGSVEETYSNGAVIVTYSNGSVKEVFPDGITVVVSLFNGDIKRTLPDGRVIYHYAADGTVQTTYPDGTEEINYVDGRQEIIHVRPQKPEEATENSKNEPGKQGSRRLPNGDREIRLPNGQREIHSASGVKCRIYPDGTTKTVFPDGRHETRYASGRLRIKDAQGNLILDTRLPTTNRPFPDPPCNLAKAASLPLPDRPS